MIFSSVNTYNFYSNVKEIKKISVNLLFHFFLLTVECTLYFISEKFNVPDWRPHDLPHTTTNFMFRQRVMTSMIFTHRDYPKLLLDYMLTIFRSSCGSGGGWGAFSFHMAKSYGCLLTFMPVSGIILKNIKKNQRT